MIVLKNIAYWKISSQAANSRRFNDYPKGVGRKCAQSAGHPEKDEDIVWSVGKLTAARKGGMILTISCEQNVWDLAADALKNVFADNIVPDNMIDLTEFHIEYNEVESKYICFVPIGKMLTEKFKPESYWDIALFTRVVPWEEQRNQMERYKFVTIPKGWYDGRNMGLLDDMSDTEGEVNNYRIQEIFDTILAYIAK